MNLCPCCSNKAYSDCCELVHQLGNADTPEQLMRARYSAHSLNLIDFIINTYHSSCQASTFRSGIEESISNSWIKLQIIKAPLSNTDEGFVEFKATFIENGLQLILHENSRFVKESGLWRYIDGDFPELDRAINKIGRNDPCPCGSGKKFKKCCDA